MDEEEDDDDDEEIKKAFGDVAERLDDDTRLEALRGVERKMMVNDGDTKSSSSVGFCIENVERHLERRLKEDDFDDFDDEFNHPKGGEKRSNKSARIYATVVAMARRRPRLERTAEEAYERTVVHPTRMFSSGQNRPNYLERILFALDACGKIDAEEKSRRVLVSSSSSNNNNNNNARSVVVSVVVVVKNVGVFPKRKKNGAAAIVVVYVVVVFEAARDKTPPLPDVRGRIERWLDPRNRRGRRYHLARLRRRYLARRPTRARREKGHRLFTRHDEKTSVFCHQ